MVKPGVGHRIRERRLELKISQADLAKAAGCSPAYIHQIESGKRKEVGRAVLRSIAEALGLALDFVLYGTEPRLAPSIRPVTTEDEMRLLAIWRRMTTDQKEMLLIMLAGLIDDHKTKAQ